MIVVVFCILLVAWLLFFVFVFFPCRGLVVVVVVVVAKYRSIDIGWEEKK